MVFRRVYTGYDIVSLGMFLLYCDTTHRPQYDQIIPVRQLNAAKHCGSVHIWHALAAAHSVNLDFCRGFAFLQSLSDTLIYLGVVRCKRHAKKTAPDFITCLGVIKRRFNAAGNPIYETLLAALAPVRGSYETFSA